ncbi:hypothetical protein FBU59_005848 [Linderina macrospora]|uniref:Uncharacterized protein n=1 Tax=Linderina macrospora TaxID=4868 RepID=A0ACC1J1Q0_9FUNG|nr:hypothetical protein FBU59_005848 [Linderina macrospora]
MNSKTFLVQALLIGTIATCVLADINWLDICTIQAVSATWSQIRIVTNLLLPFSWVMIGFDKFKQLKKLLGGLSLPKEPDLAVQLGLLQIFGSKNLELIIGPIVKHYMRHHPCPAPTTPTPGPTSTSVVVPTTSSAYPITTTSVVTPKPPVTSTPPPGPYSTTTVNIYHTH